MAITNADGSIILSTKIDTKGLQDAMAKMRQQAKGTGSAFESLSNAIKVQETRLASLRQQYASYVIRNEQGSAAAKKLSKDIKALSGSLAQNQQRLVSASASAVSFGAKAKTAIAGVGTSLKVLASYLIGIQTIFAAINFSKSGAEFATQTEASVQRLVDIYGSASDSVGDFIDQNARALGMSKAAAASFSSVYGNLFSVWADQETNAQLTNEYLRMTAVVASKTGRTVEDVQERVRSGLLGNTEAIEDLGIFVNVKTIEMTDAFQRMANGKSWEQLDAYTQQQIRSMAILEQATAKYGNQVANTSATIRSQYKAAYEDFQNSWGNIVNTVLLPVLRVLTQIFNIATAGLNALPGKSGNILENTEAITDNSASTAQNIEEQTKNQKGLNKELKKSRAGFDEIQILSANTAGDTSSGGLDSGLQGLGGDLGGTAPDGSAYVDEANAMLTAIMGFVSVAMVAIGVILLLTGHIGWGLGFIIAGAGLLTVTQASVSQEGIGIDVQNALTTALLIAGVAAIVIGIILCMCQQYVKGIALIALGAATVVADIAINWDSIKDMLSDEKVAAWVAIGGILAVVLGILLCFAHRWWAGIGLIALGATSLGVDIAVNWDAITEAFTDEKTAKWIAVGGIVAIALGILLCFAQKWAWGIGLIALGAATVATVVAVNWDSIVTNVKNFLFENSELIALISGGLLILGILVCFVNLPLGIALIAAGAVGLVTVAALNWDSIVDWVKGAWNAVKGFWNQYIAPVFTLEFWKNLAIKCGNGLIAGFEGAINGIIWAFESMINWIVDGLNKISIDIPDWVPGIGGQTWGVDIPHADLGRVSIPRLARGAVIPPNREFLAVLGDQKQGTNIEAPAELIKQMTKEAILEIGGAGQATREEHYYLGETELMSILYKLVKGGQRLNGESLAVGGDL